MIYLALLKRFWPFVAGAVLLLIVWRWHVSAIKDAYAEGVADTEDKQAEVIAVRMLENEKRERELAQLVQSKQLELQVKENANLVLTHDLNDLLAHKRVCTSDVLRSRPVPEDTQPARNGNGTAERDAAAQTFGSALTELVSECQRSTDKLGALQEWAHAITE